jgi:hypothetical protein
VLKERAGQPFQEISATAEQDATLVAAVAAWFRTQRVARDEPAGDASAWRRAARLEGHR